MKFGQLIEYNMRNIFPILENLTQNVVKKLVTDPFKKFKIEDISGSTV